MKQQSGPVPGMKKTVVLVIFIVAAGLVFLFAKSGTKGKKIIGPGDRAPEFTLAALDGRDVSLSSLRGRIVMVHFWATWCPPCVEEMPTLESLYRNLQGKGFALLAVSVNQDGAAAVAPFVQRNAFTLPVLLDSENAVARAYGTFKFPETYILDRNGIVQYKVIGPRDWNEPALVKALQEMIAVQ